MRRSNETGEQQVSEREASPHRCTPIEWEASPAISAVKLEPFTNFSELFWPSNCGAARPIDTQSTPKKNGSLLPCVCDRIEGSILMMVGKPKANYRLRTMLSRITHHVLANSCRVPPRSPPEGNIVRQILDNGSHEDNLAGHKARYLFEWLLVEQL